MKLRDNQTFLSLFYEPNVVEIATGGTDSFVSVGSWARETKQLGQVATPAPIADLMAKWVMAGKPRSVLDPAAGLGGLLAACRKLDPRVRLVGVERDAETFRRARLTAPRSTKLILADYLKAEVGLFDGIVANPPYVKAHRLDYSDSDWRYFEERLGTALNRLTNLYCLFLLKTWEDLAPHGRASVLLPAEFLNANFGEEIKERLVQVIRPALMMVFAPTVNLFADALTTSAIVFLEKGRRADTPGWLNRAQSVAHAEQMVERLCAGRSGPEDRGRMALATLRPRDKWLNLLLTEGHGSVAFTNRVGDYCRCRRGIATGANDYFCLSRPEMCLHGLHPVHVEPCITKATDADGLVFTREKLEAVAVRGRRCFLLNPSGDGPALARYLELGEQRGIPQRHLPSHRSVWYLPEKRAVADIWVGVFSREYAKFILNISGAKNLTCFHGLYARPGCETLPPLMTLFLNSSAGRLAFAQVNRFYGDGLNKLEPKDVEDMPCPAMPQLSRTEANEVTEQLLALERLPVSERTTRLDELAARYFTAIARPGKPSASPPDSVQRRRRAAPRRRHVAPVP